MKFDEDFFKDEYISGFLVDRRMKHYWAASIETLEEIDKVCRKHHITWYANGGTLLGTVRHKGFIPWDDDIDIVMKRADYERFLKIAPQELPEHYKVFDSSSDKFWVNNAAYVSNWDNNDFLVLKKERLEKYHGCPFHVAIDIFPLDYIYRDKQQEELRKSLLMIIWHTIAMIDCNSKPEEILERIDNLEGITGTKIPDWHGDYEVLKWQLRYLSDTVLQICTEEEADEIAELRWLYLWQGGANMHFKKECYDNLIYMPFHGFQMPVPTEYDIVLTGIYGDYMTPVQGTSSHSYPKFRGEVELFKKWKQQTGEKRSIEQIVEDVMKG